MKRCAAVFLAAGILTTSASTLGVYATGKMSGYMVQNPEFLQKFKVLLGVGN